MCPRATRSLSQRPTPRIRRPPTLIYMSPIAALLLATPLVSATLGLYAHATRKRSLDHMRSPTLPPHLTRRARSRSCNDKDISCASWSRDGLCDSDAVVKDLCPHSCGVCSLMCSDRDDSCAAWAKDGECTKSPDYMLKECPTSCGLCAPKCADISPDCNHWGKEGNCDSSASAAHTSAICTLSRCIVALFCARALDNC